MQKQDFQKFFFHCFRDRNTGIWDEVSLSVTGVSYAIQSFKFFHSIPYQFLLLFLLSLINDAYIFRLVMEKIHLPRLL